MVDVIGVAGSVQGRAELPAAFSERVRVELIRRAVLAENSYRLQPQGHSRLAGLNTTAAYYGAMHSYRSGRHMGDAIRPRQKLGGGAQGDVRRIPSSTKGRRAHPHTIEKKLFENMNRREYQEAIKSAVAATAENSNSGRAPIVFVNDIESISKTKEALKILNLVGFSKLIQSSKEMKSIRKGLRRSTHQKIYKKSVLFVVSGGKILNAARNLAGADVCRVEELTANLLAPGGDRARTTVWSESALKKLDSVIPKMFIK